jgi:lysophospholipase L1-like esterase
VRKFCASRDNTCFIGTEGIYLGADGKPLDELFVDDRLHLNPAGYTRWAAAIKSQLDSVLGGATR